MPRGSRINIGSAVTFWYLHNSVKRHEFGDLEKMVESAREQHSKGGESGREKRTLTELERQSDWFQAKSYRRLATWAAHICRPI